MILKG